MSLQLKRHLAEGCGGEREEDSSSKPTHINALCLPLARLIPPQTPPLRADVKFPLIKCALHHPVVLAQGDCKKTIHPLLRSGGNLPPRISVGLIQGPGGAYRGTWRGHEATDTGLAYAPVSQAHSPWRRGVGGSGP